MKKIKILDNLYMFTQKDDEKELRANTYLLKGNKNILIDAGFLIPEKIDILILTHCHFDHSRHARDYQKKGAKIAISEKDSKSLANAGEVVQPDFAREIFKTRALSCKADIILKEGEIIKNSNFKLKVINVSGHTPGSIALHEQEKKILFSGDTWFGGSTIGSFGHPGGDYNKLIKSVTKLRKIKTNLLCSGHGPIEKMKFCWN